jgi:hypothetical protein
MSPKTINLYIATPCYGDSVMVEFFQSMSKLFPELEKRNIKFNFITVATESLITRARNGLMSNFLDDDCYTHLLFIDSDIEFDPISVIKLLQCDHDLVGGIYPLKRTNWDKIKLNYNDHINKKEINKLTKNEKLLICKKSLNYAFTPVSKVMEMENYCVEVTDIATGFMLIKRNVIEKMVKSYPKLEYKPFTNDQYGNDIKYYALFDTMIHPDTGIYLSEDYAFCKRWRDIGGKVYARTDIDLSHVGKHYYKGNIITMLNSVDNKNKLK